ncbi:hypothetical protein K8I85_12160 [bacterium]|nr:hypothetical protein [bacterium]
MSTLRIQIPLLLAAAAVVLVGGDAHAQGCVAVRPMGCSTAEYQSASGASLPKGAWQVSSAYQYFRSFRHFRGDEEEANRVEDGTEVINVNHSTDWAVGYGLTDRLALQLNVPIIYYDRSSLYEHYGNDEVRNPAHARFHTGSQGLGDMRLAANYWAFDPMMPRAGNVAFGLGIKMPTGDSNVQDTFHKMASDGSDSTITKAVDQSIQLGDGGWGFTLQTEGYRSLFARGALYFNGFYLFNPKETNDVPHSVADQYFARLGLNYAVMPEHGLSASLGGRWEGVPSEDLIGGSEGRRRPGYILSLEPGVSYRHQSVSFNLNVPVALYRNRTQSVSDKERTASSGEWVQGDAAFADYLVNFSISTTFGGPSHRMDPMDGIETIDTTGGSHH